MKLINAALRHPRTVLVAVLAILLFSGLALSRSRIDIFPRLGLPTVYVAQPYGGLSPEQMEGFVTSYYEYHFLYITGVKYVDSRSVQGAALIKIEFNEGTDMSQAMAEVVGYVNRARAFMPAGTVPPFITRFDAGSVPVGQLVFSSPTRSLAEISDLALFRVRPMFSTLPGVSAPPPFGGNQKTVLVTVDPDKIRSYQLTPDQVVQAVLRSNTISPAGNLRIGDSTYITPQNGVIESLADLQNTPLKGGSGAEVYVKDVATVSLGSDVTTSYALVNGKRSVYIPVNKRTDASTWEVVQRVKAALPEMQAAIPDDIRVSYEFDQSGYVIRALRSVLFEGGLGILLTGLMVLLFLGDRRSALIVVLTIPLALLSSVTLLYLAGQTINIMTLGGLALSVGILVDESTLTIENIHRHLQMGKGKARAVADAAREMAAPKLLILLSILAVFVPALFMTGVPKALFLPLSLAVGFAMIASFLLSQSFVPVLSNWWIKEGEQGDRAASRFDRFQRRYSALIGRKSMQGLWGAGLFAVLCTGLVVFLYRPVGSSLFPGAETGQTRIRLRLPQGTRLERTEDATRRLLALADSIAGPGQVEITSAFIGTQPSSFPVNLINLWTSGPHESVTRINMRPGAPRLSLFRERLRAAVRTVLPQATLSFEPGDLTGEVLNLGSANAVEIAVVNRNLEDGKKTAGQLMAGLARIPVLRDLQIATPLNVPAIRFDIDRVRAGQLNLSADQIMRSAAAATSSSRFTAPGYWLDKATGTAYIVQVQYPEYRTNSTRQLEAVPVAPGPDNLHLLGEVSSWKKISTPGEFDRLNQQRYITLTANVEDGDLGAAFRQVQAAIDQTPVPKGSKVLLRGQPELLKATFGNLQLGLLIAIAVIFLLMTVYFQSFRLASLVLLVVPSVLAGALGLLWLSGNTLNIQSYMGMIMAVGVSVSNAVLLLAQAEQERRWGREGTASLEAASSRLRPILMTAGAMIAGMIPMAIGFGEDGSQTAPLGIAVIGGLLFSMTGVLLFLPGAYHQAVGRKAYVASSLDPDDPGSPSFVREHSSNRS